MKYLSLFSGIGAPEKALDRLGIPYELVGYSEIDKHASRSYAAIHGVSEDMNLGDITKIDATKLPKDIDLCFYGFPCQDISVAGNQKGLFNANGTKTRSGLFFDALRIIEEAKPRVAVAENVKNLTSKKFSEQFKLVLDSLETAGYNNYWQVLNAKDFGVPQNRERVFIVSIRKDVDNGTFRFPEGFPLELRLKDVLEDEVDERYYFSGSRIERLIEHKKRNAENGNGFGAKFVTGDDVSSAITTSPEKSSGQYFVAAEKVVSVGNVNPSGKGMNGNVISENGLSSTLTTNKGEGIKVLITQPHVEKVGNIYPSGGENGNIYLDTGLSPTLKAGTGINGNGIGSNNAPKVLLSDEATVRQIGNCCPTRTRDNPNQGLIYDTDGLSPSLNCMEGGNRQPFVIDDEPKVQKVGKLNSSQDGVVVSPDEVSPCHTAGHGNTPKVLVTCENATAAAVRGRYNEDGKVEQQVEVSNREYANTITSVQKDSLVQSALRIRKLTPKECFRLMDFDDVDYEKAAAVNSNTQLYKQAGNSIVVAVPYFIIAKLLECGALTA